MLEPLCAQREEWAIRKALAMQAEELVTAQVEPPILRIEKRKERKDEKKMKKRMKKKRKKEKKDKKSKRRRKEELQDGLQDGNSCSDKKRRKHTEDDDGSLGSESDVSSRSRSSPAQGAR